MSINEDFKKVVEEHFNEITEKLQQADKLVTEAEKLSEKYGIPFSFNYATYIPKSYFTKFPKVDSNLVVNLTDADLSLIDEDNFGWLFSSLC